MFLYIRIFSVVVVVFINKVSVIIVFFHRIDVVVWVFNEDCVDPDYVLVNGYIMSNK